MSIAFWRKLNFLLLLFGALIFFTFSFGPISSNDFWLQSKVGELIAENHRIPTTLYFPFTEASLHQFNAHEWLPSILFFYLVEFFGESNLPYVLASIGAVLYLSLYFILSARINDFFTCHLLVLMALLVENFRHFLRPELFSLFFLTFFWTNVDSFYKAPRLSSFLSAICIMVLWANSHGSFILGVIIAFIYLLSIAKDSRTSQISIDKEAKAELLYFLIFFSAIFLGSLVTPFGFALYDFVWVFTNSSFSGSPIVEWFSTFDIRSYSIIGVWIGLSFIFIASTLLLLNRRRVSTLYLLLFTFFVCICLKSIRFYVYIGIAFSLCWCFSGAHKTIFAKHFHHPTIKATILLSFYSTVLSVYLMYGNFNGGRFLESYASESYSPSLIRFIENGPLQGNVFNSYELGSELVYRGFPKLLPSIDSRIDSYGEDYYNYHESLLKDSLSLKLFVEKYDVSYLLLSYSDYNTLANNYPNFQHDWRLLISDGKVVMFEKIR